MIQEESTQRTVALVVRTGKLTRERVEESYDHVSG